MVDELRPLLERFRYLRRMVHSEVLMSLVSKLALAPLQTGSLSERASLSWPATPEVIERIRTSISATDSTRRAKVRTSGRDAAEFEKPARTP